MAYPRNPGSNADNHKNTRKGAIICHANRMILSVAAAIVAMTMLAAQAYAQDNPYRIEEGWGTLPDGRKWGGTIGVDVDRDGNIWVFERCGGSSCAESNLAPIIKLDSSGKVLKMFRRRDVQLSARALRRPRQQRLGRPPRPATTARATPSSSSARKGGC